MPTLTPAGPGVPSTPPRPVMAVVMPPELATRFPAVASALSVVASVASITPLASVAPLVMADRVPMVTPVTPVTPAATLDEAERQLQSSEQAEGLAWMALALIRADDPQFGASWQRWVDARSRLGACTAQLWDTRMDLLLRA